MTSFSKHYYLTKFSNRGALYAKQIEFPVVLPDVVFYHHSGVFWTLPVLFENLKNNVVLKGTLHLVYGRRSFIQSTRSICS